MYVCSVVCFFSYEINKYMTTTTRTKKEISMFCLKTMSKQNEYNEIRIRTCKRISALKTKSERKIYIDNHSMHRDVSLFTEHDLYYDNYNCHVRNRYEFCIPMDLNSSSKDAR